MTARRGASWAGVVAVAAAIALAVPATSSANNRTYINRAGSVAYAAVHGTHGFLVKFSETNRRRFKVTVKGHGVTTTYATRGRSAGDGHVSARLGKLGTFDLRFVPVGEPRGVPIPHWCRGPEGGWQGGHLVGRYRFRGERNYTQVRGVRAPAALESWSRLRCHYLSARRYRPSAVPRGRVSAWRTGRRRAAFGAILYHWPGRPPGRRVLFRASTWEQDGRVSVSREVKVPAAEGTITFPGGPKLPEEIRLEPPAPFTGTATFTRTPESTFIWAGDLAVDLPGLAPLRLTGPHFGASVCALEGCVRREPEREPTTGSE